MAPAYQNVNSGQVVVSDGPRPDLEAQARWDKIPVPEPTTTPPAPPAPPVTTPASVDSIPPTGVIVEAGSVTAALDATVTPAVTGAAAPAGDPATPPEPPAPVPDETWTHEQLDDLAEKREIKFPANTKKAAKVAVLTAPAGE